MICDPPDFRESVRAVRRPDDRRTAEQWIRAVFEGAPRPARLFLVAGWRGALRLRLGRLRDSDHVLGWRIEGADTRLIRLSAPSPMLAAELLLSATDTTAILTTSVSFTRRPARLLWAMALPIHRRIVPYLMWRASRTSAA